MKPKYISLYIDLAERISKMSYAKRLHVGCVIVRGNSILSYGWNGMPTGWENNCENEVIETYAGFEGAITNTKLVTKPEVIHAEANAISKLARSTESSEGATLFCTHAPCIECAKLIYQSGISTVYFKEHYRDESGLKFLSQGNVNVHHYNDSI